MHDPTVAEPASLANPGRLEPEVLPSLSTNNRGKLPNSMLYRRLLA